MSNAIFRRYFYAVIWTLLLFGFSYTELWVGSLFEPNVHLEGKMIEMLNSGIMLFSSGGLVAMLFVDNVITKKIIRDNTGHSNLFVGILIMSMLIILFLAVLANGIEKGTYTFPAYFHLWYLFLLFLVCLVFYKAETLNIKHNSSNIT